MKIKKTRISGMSKKEYKEKRISQSISPVMVFLDDEGHYFAPYCDYSHHRGFIGKNKLEEKSCMSNGCDYLKIFRLSKKIHRPYTCIGLDSKLPYK